MDLVIVESPSKAKTLQKYLGNDYKVLSSVGHIMDLPPAEIGVDIEDDFKPKYTVIKNKKKVIDELKKVASNADKVFLASDPDREGEAIAWHIQEQIKAKNNNIYRVQFYEITPSGVSVGMQNPTSIDMNRVNAQQSRRVLDRLVGYEVSPLLWKPLKYGLSAGRVQSVALHLLLKREKEISKFKPKEYWSIEVDFKVNGKTDLRAELHQIDGKKANVGSKDIADDVVKELKKGSYNIAKIDVKKQKKKPALPFITSTMQQDAINRLGFSAKRVMMVAQQLYEGIEVGKKGTIGLITYMRTDSTRISDDALGEGLKYIEKNYGKEYVGSRPVSKKTKAVQDAHEAIRPTDVKLSPDSLKNSLTSDQLKLYRIIWQRFLASISTPAEFENTAVLIANGKYSLRASSSRLLFDGYKKIYDNESAEKASVLPEINTKDKLKAEKYDPEQHFTQPPKRYTEASLVKELENNGIGRPSTYASILSTLTDKGYVEINEKKFVPTELGRVVDSLLSENFNIVFDLGFTAKMEEQLDSIEAGDNSMKDVLSGFYNSFRPEVDKATEHFESHLKLGIKCPKCKADINVKYGKNGVFAACSKYPECDFTSDYKYNEDGKVELIKKELDVIAECDKCGKDMVVKSSRGNEFIACTGYPDCKNIKNFLKDADGNTHIIEPGETIDKCEKDGGNLVLKSGKNGLFAACANYPNCRNTKPIKLENGKVVIAQPTADEVEIECDKCGKPMKKRFGRFNKPFYGCTGYPDCKNTKAISQ